MTQSSEQGNEFTDRDIFKAEGMPATLGSLLAGRHVFLDPTPVDLREMSKEFEAANTAGLPLYTIRQRWPEDMQPHPLEDLLQTHGDALRNTLKINSWLMAEFGGAQRVRIFMPQAWAYLGQTLARLSEGMQSPSLPDPVRYTVLLLPQPLSSRNGRTVLEHGWFADGDQAVMIGLDDPIMLMRAIESGLGATFFASWPLEAASLDAEQAMQVGSIWFDVPLDDRARPVHYTPDAKPAGTNTNSGWVIPPDKSN